MPSPFPGMDPFLEHPDFFPDLHGRFHVYLSESLQACLPAPYFAVINQRLWVEPSARYIEPDTDVLYGDWTVGESSVAWETAERTRTRPLVFEMTDDEHREPYVQIRTRLAEGGERVVTAIEVLSLSNKTPGQRSRELYLEKQAEILGSQVHLVEIDLLRGGQHTTPVSWERLSRKAGPFDYHVSVHRFDQQGRFFIYPRRLPDPLPVIGIPLLPGDDQVSLDLQAVLNRCYETGPYRRRVVYESNRIVPPLTPEQTEWLERDILTKLDGIDSGKSRD